MFQGFTDQAKRAVDVARESAGQARKTECGLDHLLLGLAAATGSGAAAILEGMGLDESTLRARLGAPVDAVAREVSFAAESVRALDEAKDAASRLGHEGIDTMHILIGILNAGKDVPGFDAAAARQFVAEVFGIQTQQARIHPDVREWIVERVQAEAAQLHAAIDEALIDRAIDMAGRPGQGAPADGPVRRLVRRAIALRHGGEVLEAERAFDSGGPDAWAKLRRQAEALPTGKIPVTADDLSRAAKELAS